MSEERIQEIKDSINFQYEVIVSKGIDKSALLFTDEEQELLEEVERLNNKLSLIKGIIRTPRALDKSLAYAVVKTQIENVLGSDKE